MSSSDECEDNNGDEQLHVCNCCMSVCMCVCMFVSCSCVYGSVGTVSTPRPSDVFICHHQWWVPMLHNGKAYEMITKISDQYPEVILVLVHNVITSNIAVHTFCY